jgi:hypothetical protein
LGWLSLSCVIQFYSLLFSTPHHSPANSPGQILSGSPEPVAAGGQQQIAEPISTNTNNRSQELGNITDHSQTFGDNNSQCHANNNSRTVSGSPSRVVNSSINSTESQGSNSKVDNNNSSGQANNSSSVINQSNSVNKDGNTTGTSDNDAAKSPRDTLNSTVEGEPSVTTSTASDVAQFQR